MATHQGFYLPKLRDSNVARASEGIFARRDKRLVRELADSLEIGEDRPEAARSLEVSSIPDIYARPLLFQGAFINKGHFKHKEYITEWRGLLSLLALHEVKPGLKKSIRFVAVSYDDWGDNALVRAIKELAPPDMPMQANAPAYRWEDFVLIQFDGITLGALSPSTLVFTAADYDLHTTDGPRPYISEFLDAQGRLCPPSNPEDLRAVGEWLLWLNPEQQTPPAGLNALFSTEEKLSKYRGAIFDELKEWLKAIREVVRQAFDSDELDAPKYRPGTGTEFTRLTGSNLLDRYGIYKLLLTPLQLTEGANIGVESDVALLLKGRPNAPYKHVLVIPADTEGRNLRLWGDVKLDTLGNNPLDSLFRGASGHTLGGHPILDGDEPGIWVRPEQFFLTDTLVKAKTGNFLADSEVAANGKNPTFLLPIKAELLHYFTVEEIKEMEPAYAVVGEGRVTFSLRLPLRNGHLTVKKTYVRSEGNQATGEGKIQERPVPVLELFPNYVGSFWGRYYLLSSDADYLAVPVNQAGTPFHIGPRQEQRADSSTERLRAEITRISGPDCFPEAILLRKRDPASEEVGLVLVEKYAGAVGDEIRERPFNPTSSAIFGVDFGTSNTNVFIKQGDTSQPLTLEFSKNLRSLTAPQPQQDEVNHAFLVPTQDKRFPTPTALRVFNGGRRANLLLDYFLYFPKEKGYQYPANVQIDLKWQEENRENINNFLESLVFLLVLEAARRRIGTVEFRYTYPKSFVGRRLEDYKNGWRQALRDIRPIEGANTLADGRAFLDGKWEDSTSEHALRSPEGRFKIKTDLFDATEGEAAGAFFQKEGNAGIQTGAVCIDVGGGTSDFSLLYEGGIMYDTSVLLAGREVAKMLMNNLHLGDFLFSETAAEALRSAVKSDAADINFATRLNYILRSEHQIISATLGRSGQDESIQDLRKSLLVEFGALAFYAGHLVVALNKFRGRQFANGISERGIGLYWGGNASKMLDWVDGGSFNPESSTGPAKMLNVLFGSVIVSSKLSENERIPIRSMTLLSQRQSPGHKNEAAGGVVLKSTYRGEEVEVNIEDELNLDLDASAGDPRVLQGLVMGERVVVNGIEYAPHHVFSEAEKEALLKAPLMVDTQLEQFTLFLNGINTKSGFDKSEYITLTDRQRLDIRNHVHETYAEQFRLAENERSLEPTLIVEVRYLLKLLRDKKV